MAGMAAEDGGVPADDWLTLDVGETPWRQKVTLRLERETLRYFRGLGPGYQARIDRVLAAWVAARLGAPVLDAERHAAEAAAAREAKDAAERERRREMNAEFDARQEARRLKEEQDAERRMEQLYQEMQEREARERMEPMSQRLPRRITLG